MFDYCIKMVFQFIEDMRKQKLRCFLTMSGITWGTMSVILLLSIGESFRKASIKNMTGMGNNIVILSGSVTTQPHAGMPPGRPIHLLPETVTLLKNHIPEIESISPEIQKQFSFSLAMKRQNYTCVGVYPVYSTIRNILPRKGGRFINRLDMENRRRVIFLGSEIHKKLFGETTDSVGRKIMVNGIPFTVIGVMLDKVQNSSYMTQDKNIAIMPFSTCYEMIGVTYINRIIYRAQNPVETPRMKERTYKVLGEKYGFSPEDKDALRIWDTSEMMQFFHYFFLGFEAFLLLGGLLTLIVGGIGVANIMYVTIRERRREIGIKSALGATPTVILTQFMLESSLIMLIGAFIGVLGAWILVTLIGAPALSDIHSVLGIPTIDLNISLITATILALIGFAAGWSPAKRASDMDPVQALEF